MVGMLLFKGGKEWGGFGWVTWGLILHVCAKTADIEGNNGKFDGNLKKKCNLRKFLASQIGLKIQNSVL